jgi:hypothetical protein
MLPCLTLSSPSAPALLISSFFHYFDTAEARSRRTECNASLRYVLTEEDFASMHFSLELRNVFVAEEEDVKVQSKGCVLVFVGTKLQKSRRDCRRGGEKINFLPFFRSSSSVFSLNVCMERRSLLKNGFRRSIRFFRGFSPRLVSSK